MSPKLLIQIEPEPLPDTDPAAFPELGQRRGVSAREGVAALIELGDLIESAARSLEGKIQTTSKLTIEVKGSISSMGQVEAGVSSLVLKLGGSGNYGKEDSITFILETTLEPGRASQT